MYRFFDIIVYISLISSLKLFKFWEKIGSNVPYWCAKFEINWTMGRLFLCGSKIIQKQCEEEEGEEKCEENGPIFGSVYFAHH